MDFAPLPNGVIHYNMSLSTTNILIDSVLFPYQSRIVSVSIPYRFRINPVSFPYQSRIVLLLFSYWEAETIRKQYGIERRMNE